MNLVRLNVDFLMVPCSFKPEKQQIKTSDGKFPKKRRNSVFSSKICRKETSIRLSVFCWIEPTVQKGFSLYQKDI